jgi:hypothetical protein
MPTDSLEIGGVTWTRVASLANSGPMDRHFVLTVDPDSGASFVQFGDGATGQRLPIGTRNLAATYEAGTGESGNPGSDLGITLVEQFAHAADVLAEMEDRVAEEGYVGTKCVRRSRHRRLMDLAVGVLIGVAVWRAFAGLSRDDIRDAKETVKSKLNSISEMGEMESLRLQMAMDRLSKLMSTLSNLLKKASQTAQGITQNIK